MARRLIAGVAATVCACAVAILHADFSRPLVVAVRLKVDPSVASRGITVRVKDEAAIIWNANGVQLDWVDEAARGRVAGGVFVDATVERRLERSRRWRWPPVLGLVVSDPDMPAVRPIHVSFDAIEKALSSRPRTGRRPDPGIVLDSELARALGRVLAHEIGHVLTGVPGHDRAGLMRPFFGAEELADPDSRPFRLTCDGAERIRRRLRTLTRDTRLTPSEDLRETTPEFGNGASCIAVQPAR
jgi:hypothetical protein